MSSSPAQQKGNQAGEDLHLSSCTQHQYRALQPCTTPSHSNQQAAGDTAAATAGCAVDCLHTCWSQHLRQPGVLRQAGARRPAAEHHVACCLWRCMLCCAQDPAFDKVIKALYGDVDQFDAEVR